MAEENGYCGDGEGEITRRLLKVRVASNPGMASQPLSPATLSPPKRRQRTTSLSGTGEEVQDVLHRGRKKIYTAGRPPWYDVKGEMPDVFCIGICGGSASGKTTVARKIIEALDIQWVSLLSMDSFYKVLTEEEHEGALANEHDFDHPNAFDFNLLIKTLKRLKSGKKVDVPIYSFITHSREKNSKTIYGANVVIFEGILAFCSEELVKLMDMKVFVDTDSDIRLARRLKRDIGDRGRDLEGVLKQYSKFVKPSYDHYIAPSMRHADIIVPRGGENKVAVYLIVQQVQSQLVKMGHALRPQLLEAAHAEDDESTPRGLYVLEDTKQVQGLHTKIRNQKTGRDDFIFYSKRLMRLLIEYALSLLPFKNVCVETIQNFQYEGKALDVHEICGVSILRAGECMEPALTDVCKDVRLGKILIQTNGDTGEPELHYLRLPKDIKNSYVVLMDATVATGAAAMMAIRVLLDHDVPEDHILLCSLLMAVEGVHTVAYAFPNVKIVTTAVDKEVNDEYHILPGIGNFGDRYFGTEVPPSDFLVTGDATMYMGDSDA